MFTVYDKQKTIERPKLIPDKDNICGVSIVYENVPTETKVYSVRDDKNGYPQFLIYEDNQWKWVSAKRFMGDML